jgi:hypothetical protein
VLQHSFDKPLLTKIVHQGVWHCEALPIKKKKKKTSVKWPFSNLLCRNIDQPLFQRVSKAQSGIDLGVCKLPVE